MRQILLHGSAVTPCCGKRVCDRPLRWSAHSAGKKTIERSQHLITRLVRETEMGESLRDFGWQVSAVTAGGVMISAAHPKTLRRSRVTQVPFRNRVTLYRAAIRSRQPRTKPDGQQLSFPRILLAVPGSALATAEFRAFRGTSLLRPTSEPRHSPLDFSRQPMSAEGCSPASHSRPPAEKPPAGL